MTPGMLPALPLRDVLDDEEVLARPDVPERPGFAHDYGKRPCAAQPVLLYRDDKNSRALSRKTPIA